MKTDFATYIDSQNEGLIKTAPPRPYLIRLVRHLLDMADAEHQALSPIDKDTFEDVLKYGISEVARLQSVSINTVRSRIDRASDTLMSQIAVWQDAHSKIAELNAHIAELEAIAAPKDEIIQQQAEKLTRLEQENARLQSLLSDRQSQQCGLWEDMVCTKTPKGYTLVSPELKRKLNLRLEELDFPYSIVKTLNNSGIYYVKDLIPLTERELSGLDSLTLTDCSRIINHLDLHGLRLNAKLVYNSRTREYYTKECHKRVRPQCDMFN